MSRAVIVEADGGSRGNPGPAGCGALVRDADTGDVLAERAVPLGEATNNYAEYTGLIIGLRAAADVGAGTVDVRMDSKLVVEQMSGRWKIKNTTLQPLARQARDIAAGFESVSYQWIPRAKNSAADHLANVAMDEQAGIDTTSAGPAPGAPEGADTGGEREVPSRTDRGSGQEAGPTRWMGAVGEPTRLVLLRHGQTEMSVDRRYSGRGDVALTELGLQQAAAAAKRLAADREIGTAAGPVPVISSPLTRATQTARAVADALPGTTVETRQGLVETDFGQWEGLSFAEAAERDPARHAEWLADTSVAPPGGESFDAALERSRALCDELLAEFSGRTIVLVSHVTPIKCLLRTALGVGPALMHRLHLDLASVSVAEFYSDGHASVRLVNDTCHLRDR